MSARHEDTHLTPDETPTPSAVTGGPTLAEDLLLLLFQPGSAPGRTGSIAGETTLYYVLAGAVLAELALGDHVRTGTGRVGAMTVEAVTANPPSDYLLRSSWEYVADRARGVQTVLAATGPSLREPLLERLIERGDLQRSSRKTLGIFRRTLLQEGGSGRRDSLLAEVRSVLVGGTQATDRIAALAALVYASGTLPQFDPYIPWISIVIARAETLKDGSWGAGAAATAVTRTVAATIVNHAAAAATSAQRR